MKPYITLAEAEKQADSILDAVWEGIKTQYPLLSKPIIVWKRFGYRVAGRANSFRNVITMNINYLYSKDYNTFIKNTTIHEIAHIVADKIFHSHGHDQNWKFVARALGDDGGTYHHYRKPDNKPLYTKINIHCKCGIDHVMTQMKAEKARTGVYICRTCKCNLKDMKQEIIYA